MSAKFRKSPTRKLSLKSGILPKIRIETTENVFPDAKNALLAAREDTNTRKGRKNLDKTVRFVSGVDSGKRLFWIQYLLK